MERVDGVILRDGAALASLDPETARRCSEELVDVLARIHTVDYRAVGLGEFGRPDGFLERQVRRWGEQWERSKTREQRRRRRARRAGCSAALPESGPPAIVHGDYRLDNTMLAPDDPGTVVAVLDWEMSTLGDPLADLGLFLLYWGSPTAQNVATGEPIGSDRASSPATRSWPGTRSAAGATSTSSTGTSCSPRTSSRSSSRGSTPRIRMGKTLGEGFTESDALVTGLVEGALDEANRSSIAALRG